MESGWTGVVRDDRWGTHAPVGMFGNQTVWSFSYALFLGDSLLAFPKFTLNSMLFRRCVMSLRAFKIPRAGTKFSRFLNFLNVHRFFNLYRSPFLSLLCYVAVFFSLMPTACVLPWTSRLR